MSKAYSVKEFLSYQHDCDSVQELADCLGQKESQVRQRIKNLKENGFGAYLKPYNDIAPKRGKKSLAEQFAELETWEHMKRREQLDMDDNNIRMQLAVQ